DNSLSFHFDDPSTPDIYTLSLHDALPIYRVGAIVNLATGIQRECPSFDLRYERRDLGRIDSWQSQEESLLQQRLHSLTPSKLARSEEHTSELQSPYDLVCRLLLEKKKQNK